MSAQENLRWWIELIKTHKILQTFTSGLFICLPLWSDQRLIFFARQLFRHFTRWWSWEKVVFAIIEFLQQVKICLVGSIVNFWFTMGVNAASMGLCNQKSATGTENLYLERWYVHYDNLFSIMASVLLVGQYSSMLRTAYRSMILLCSILRSGTHHFSTSTIAMHWADCIAPDQIK